MTFLGRSVKQPIISQLNYELNVEDNEQIVINPKFFGLDKKERPFQIFASQARTFDSNNSFYKLDEPKGTLNDNEGSKILIESLKGEFDKNQQKVHLFKNVKLINSNGLNFKTQSAYIDLTSNEIFGNFSEKIITNLKKNGYSTYQDELNNNSIRFVTAWNTTQKDIDKLISAINNN